MDNRCGKKSVREQRHRLVSSGGRMGPWSVPVGVFVDNSCQNLGEVVAEKPTQ